MAAETTETQWRINRILSTIGTSNYLAPFGPETSGNSISIFISELVEFIQEHLPRVIVLKVGIQLTSKLGSAKRENERQNSCDDQFCFLFGNFKFVMLDRVSHATTGGEGVLVLNAKPEASNGFES